jgi:cbb3-type cytochrome oxidase subunit 1
LLFWASMIGVLLAVDAIRFNGRYRTEVWRDAQYQGQSFTREVEYRLQRSLW